MKISLPGFGLPLTSRDDRSERFKIAILDRHEAPLLTVREYTMMELINRITDKPDWNQKILDATIVAKWKQEALAANGPDLDISAKMVDWVIAEVGHKAEIFKQIDCIETLDGVWKSDTIVPRECKEALQKAAASLENVPKKDKDWHPGSNKQVLDLVHPSIYPLVYGQSKILTDKVCGVDDCMAHIGQGQTLSAISAEEVVGKEWSRTFQWLPAEFETPAGTEDVKITSYINNLRPDSYQELYSVIAQITAKAIPLWNRTLTLLSGKHTISPRIKLDDRLDYYGSKVELEQEKDEDDEDFYNREDQAKGQREIVQPEPEEFQTPAERLNPVSRFAVDPPDLNPVADLRKDFGRLQIIVKLANIYLTPEKPSYDGGSWHVEGQANEFICATALYYYDSDNISESLLAFRQYVEEGMDLPYAQDDHRAMETIFGFDNETAAIQDLGKVVTREGRLLTFPNVMQHRVLPFHLADPTRPGHRKILALFLVDPHQRIISTANIPPQQKAWWKDLVHDAGVMATLPREISDQILNMTDFPISMKETKAQRLQLMDERKKFVTAHNQDFELHHTFALCEH